MATSQQIQFIQNTKRRKLLLKSGGMSPALADHRFRGFNNTHVPSPPLTTAQVEAPVTIVAHVIAQAGQGQTIWQDSTLVCLLGINASGLILSAAGFGFVANIPLASPIDAGEFIYTMGADPTTGRVTIHMNGVKVFDDTNAGFTSWSSAGATFSFGALSAGVAIYDSLEFYFDRLPAGR